MTDGTPTDGTPTASDAPWLAVALRDIAETAPVAAAPPLDAPPLAVTGDHGGGGRGPRVILGIAAAVLLIAAVAAVAVLAGDGGGSDEEPASIRTGEPTGWYVPTDLPDGWMVRDVSLIQDGRPCPCTKRLWVDPNTASWSGYSAFPASSYEPVVTGEEGSEPIAGGPVGEIKTDEPVDVDLGGGTTGQLLNGGLDANQITWVEGDQARALSSAGVSRDDLITAARDLVGQPDPTEAIVPGWDEVYRLDEDGPEAPATLVNVELETDQGRIVRYVLLPSGDVGTFIPGFRPVERTIEGQELPLIGLRPTAGRDRVVNPIIGRWPGSDVYIDLVNEVNVPTQDEIDTLAASLRPASAGAWERFVASVGNTDPRLTEPPTMDALSQEG